MISKESFIIGYFYACYHELVEDGEDPKEAFEFTISNMKEILTASGFELKKGDIEEYNKINSELDDLCDRLLSGC